MSNHWNKAHRKWGLLGPPLRPTNETVMAVGNTILPHDRRVLLLGVTPEFAGLGRELVAVDRSAAMIAGIWPGDTGRRRAISADWNALPLEDASVTAVIGDGSLNAIPFGDDTIAILNELARVLTPGGRVVIRFFVTSKPTETLEQARNAAFAGEIGSFHALKWLLAMACVAEQGDPNIRVAQILAAFDSTFPDRGSLADSTGWSMEVIATIDRYAGSETVLSFPTLPQVSDMFGSRFDGVRFLESGDYPLSERCPLVVCSNRTGAS